MEDMAEFKWSIVVVLLILAWFFYSFLFFFFSFFATWKMINPIHITKLKLLYDVELAKQIGGYQKAKPLKKKKNWKKNKFES